MARTNRKSGFVLNADSPYYAKEASKHKLLTREEEATLSRTSKGHGKEAQRAKDEIFLRNMRLVMSISRSLGKSIDFQEDLIQEGSIGLMRAIEKFDPEKGFRFSTYASWWIRQAVLRYAYAQEEIRLPSQVSASKNLVQRIIRDYPGITDEGIAEKTGYTTKYVATIKALPKVDRFLDDPLSVGDGDLILGETLHDPNAKNSEDLLQEEQLGDLFEEVFRSLDSRDQDIFGAWIFGERTLQQIGNEWGLSRERVRQIVARNIDKMRLCVGKTPLQKPRKPRKPREADSLSKD